MIDSKRSLRHSTRQLLYFCAPLALSASLAAPAHAVIVDKTTIINTFGYSIGDASLNVPDSGPSTSNYVGSNVPEAQSELGLNYNATADKSGFFFLHDHYCVGGCSTTSQTTITFDLIGQGSVNTEGPELARFDSQITPGHLARLFGRSSDMSGSFDFTVVQITPLSVEGFIRTELYHASGSVTSSGITIDMGSVNGVPLVYNGIPEVPVSVFDGQGEVLDWGTTNLNLNLDPIAVGGRSQLIYTATYRTNNYDSCSDITLCGGLEVAFGDPRNDGGVTQFRTGGELALDADDPAFLRPLIGGIYDPHLITANFVPQGSQLPGDQPAPPEYTYNRQFQAHVLGVPEPASWAMMIAGFGIAGAAARRRRAGLRLA